MHILEYGIDQGLAKYSLWAQSNVTCYTRRMVFKFLKSCKKIEEYATNQICMQNLKYLLSGFLWIKFF